MHLFALYFYPKFSNSNGPFMEKIIVNNNKIPLHQMCKGIPVIVCDPVGIRTPNLLGRNEVHYPVVLQGQNKAANI